MFIVEDLNLVSEIRNQIVEQQKEYQALKRCCRTYGACSQYRWDSYDLKPYFGIGSGERAGATQTRAPAKSLSVKKPYTSAASIAQPIRFDFV